MKKIRETLAACCSIAIVMGLYSILNSAEADNVYNNYPYQNHSKEYRQSTSNESDWDITIGATTLVTPEYEGGDEYEIRPLPFVDIKYKDIIELNAANGLRYNIIYNDNVKFGIGVGADFGREEDDADRLNGLGDIDPTAEGIAFLEYREGLARAGITFEQDLINGDGHGGHKVKFDTGVLIPVSESVIIRPSVSTTYASDDYMESYFGLDNAQSLRSGLASYNAESGFKDVTGGIFAAYKLTDHWTLSGLVQYKQLIGDAADSPIVEEDGAITGGTFITYKF